MIKKVLFILVVVSILLLSGCEFFEYLNDLADSTYEFVFHNNSSETISACYFRFSDSNDWTLLTENFEPIPIGASWDFNTFAINTSFRAESATMYWECFISLWDAECNETITWTLTNASSTTLP